MDEESLYLDAHNYDYYRLAHKKLTNVLEWGIYLSIFGWDEVGADEKKIRLPFFLHTRSLIPDFSVNQGY